MKLDTKKLLLIATLPGSALRSFQISQQSPFLSKEIQHQPEFVFSG